VKHPEDLTVHSLAAKNGIDDVPQHQYAEENP